MQRTAKIGVLSPVTERIPMNKSLHDMVRPLIARGLLPEPVVALGRMMFGRPLWPRVERLEQDTGSLPATVEQLRREVAALRQDVAELRTADSRLNDQNRVLQRLFTSTASARPPGAAALVRQLYSPAVSVIIPTFNRAAFVGEAIESVQRQSFENWELLVVDDSSSDGTEASVAPYLADRRIRYIRQAKAGGASARNRGIAESTGGLIAYLDDDNLWYPDFLLAAVDSLTVSPEIDVVYGALVTDLHLNDGRILWNPFDRSTLLVGNFIDTNVIVHRRELIGRYGGWDERVARVADWDLMLRFTVDKPAHRLAVLAAFYREVDTQRVSRVHAGDDSDEVVLSRWDQGAAGTVD